MNLTPRSDVLIAEVKRLIQLYDDGADTAPNILLHIIVATANWEPEINQEHDALMSMIVEEVDPVTHMSRNERLQAAADAGVDTWEDYRGEK